MDGADMFWATREVKGKVVGGGGVVLVVVVVFL